MTISSSPYCRGKSRCSCSRRRVAYLAASAVLNRIRIIILQLGDHVARRMQQKGARSYTFAAIPVEASVPRSITVCPQEPPYDAETWNRLFPLPSGLFELVTATRSPSRPRDGLAREGSILNAGGAVSRRKIHSGKPELTGPPSRVGGFLPSARAVRLQSRCVGRAP